MNALDPVLAEIAAVAASGPDALEGDPMDARARLAAAIASTPDVESRDATTPAVDRTISHDEIEVSIRVTAAKDRTPELIVVFLHGGGYVLGSAELADDISQRLARELSAVVIAVDYRLAPEHPFPAALEDAIAALRWIDANRTGFAAADTPVVLVGESAGGNIAAAASLEAGIDLAAQVLVVAGPNFQAIRDASDVDGSMFSVASVTRIVDHAFAGDWDTAGAYPASAAASPCLGDAPPTLMALAGCDPTAPVGRAFARQLEAAGVEVDVLDFDDMFHPFLGFAHISPGAAKAFSQICDRTRALLHTS
jgi:acetyl esterase